MIINLSILNYGWASMYNSGAGVTGGQGGATYEFNEASVYNGKTGFNALWEFMRGDNLLTPMILVWTGLDVDLPEENYRIDAGINTTSGSPKNKTIVGSNGQLITGATFRMWGWENIIWLNFKRQKIPVRDVAPKNNGDGWSVLGCLGVIIGYCEMDGEYTANDESLIGDGGIDTGEESNYISYVNCYFEDMVRGGIVGGDDDDTQNRGKLKVSVVNCRFRQIQIRQLFCRFGEIHFINTYHYYDPPFTATGNQNKWCRVGELGFEAQMLYERCYLEAHRYCWWNQDFTEAPESGLKSIDCFYGPQWEGEGATDRWIDTQVDIRGTNVIFEPWNIIGYKYPPLRTPQQAKDYTLEWAAAVYHLIDPEPTPRTLTLTTTAGGTATRDPASGTIEQSTTVILTATPSSGFNFSRWENLLTGQVLSTSTTYNHVMTSDISIVAVFVSDVPVEPGDAIRFCRIDEPIV